MADFVITPDTGRIGPFWWFNSITTPWTLTSPEVDGLRLVQWGTFGIGRNVSVTWTTCDD